VTQRLRSVLFSALIQDSCQAHSACKNHTPCSNHECAVTHTYSFGVDMCVWAVVGIARSIRSSQHACVKQDPRGGHERCPREDPLGRSWGIQS
jgi:hypothetical protein